jgi:hypothetical protein
VDREYLPTRKITGFFKNLYQKMTRMVILSWNLARLIEFASGGRRGNVSGLETHPRKPGLLPLVRWESPGAVLRLGSTSHRKAQQQ